MKLCGRSFLAATRALPVVTGAGKVVRTPQSKVGRDTPMFGGRPATMSNDRILDHCEQPYHRGCTPHATHAHEVSNPLCGDAVRIELVIQPSAGWWVESNSGCPHPSPLPEGEGERRPHSNPVYPLAGAEGEGVAVVREAYFTGTGCRVSQAAASMLVEHVEGRSVDHIKCFSARDMLALFGPPLTPLRQRCCLLAWQALQVALYSPLRQPSPSSSA